MIDPRWDSSPLPPTSIYEIDGIESEVLAKACRQMTAAHVGSDLDNEELLATAEVCCRYLPAELVQALIRFRVAGNDAGGFLIRNVPIDEMLPPTPEDGMAAGHWSRLCTSTVGELCVMSVLGDVIAYADEKGGRLIQDTIPVRGAETRQENTNSALLELHIEDGFHPFKPHFVGLHCLRGDDDQTGLTVFGSARSAVRDLSADTVARLRTPQFRVKHSTSFTGDGAATYSPPLPALSGPANDPDILVGFDGTSCTTAEGERALELLRAAVMRNLVSVVLKPGDLLVIDNRRAVHGRTGFTPRYDGRDRWLRRCFVVSDLRRSLAVRAGASRVCAPYSPGDDRYRGQSVGN
jgi:L-asparagine oxygenase